MRKAGRESVVMVIPSLARLWMRRFLVEEGRAAGKARLRGAGNMLNMRSYRGRKPFVKSNRPLAGKMKGVENAYSIMVGSVLSCVIR